MKKFINRAAIKAQLRRKNFWLLVLIATLSIAIIGMLIHITRQVQELEQAELNYNQQLLHQLEQAKDLASIQVDFKTQVQEWKDLLLRGHDADLYKKYWQQFEQKEASVHSALTELHNELLDLESAPDTAQKSQLSDSDYVSKQQLELQKLQLPPRTQQSFSDRVATLIEAHMLLGKIYREFLGRYDLAQSSDNAFVIDQNVRGLDRWLSEQLAILHNASVAQQEALTTQTNASQLGDIHELRLQIQRSVGLVILILLANLLLLADRLRSSAVALSDAGKKSAAAMYELAYSDSLTRLPNRRLFHDKLEQAIALSGNTGQHGGLIFLDLDNFKTLNDTKGHAKGDMLLIEVAQRLRDSVRATDIVARLGGDEFVVLLDVLPGDAEAAIEQAGQIAEKICVALNQPYLLKTYTHHGGASIGVAVFGHGVVNSEDLLKRADTAMYQAKRAGRNTVRFYDQATQNALEARSDLEHHLYSESLPQQLELYYQIQVDVAGKAIGAEALLRWHHPELGLLHPAQFIALAEESELIINIGNWVLHAACAQIKHWQDAPLMRDLVLSINVSAAQLHRSKHVDSNNHYSSASRMRKPSIVEQVQTELNQSGINPAQLKLEITESLAAEDIDYTLQVMQHLKALGVSLSMDDFGTGHSSLNHLKRLPIDQIKIDQSFVKMIGSDTYDQAIVKTMINMAHSLNVEVMAEGVENKVQEQKLIAKGCRAFQGYYYGKPLPIKDFEASLQARVQAAP